MKNVLDDYAKTLRNVTKNQTPESIVERNQIIIMETLALICIVLKTNYD